MNMRRLSHQAVEKPLESSRGPEPSRTTIVPGGVNGGDGRIFAAENSIFQSKNRFFAVFAAGIRRIQAKTGEGGREAENPLGFQVSPLAKLPTAQIEDLRRGTWPGSLLPRPPACQNFFDKLTARLRLRRFPTQTRRMRTQENRPV